MLLLLTIGLVLVALVALVIGFVTSALAPIYVSIACSVLAALVLFFFSRLSKREAPASVGAGPAPLPGPTVTGEAASGPTVTVLGSAPPATAAAEHEAEPITEQVVAVGPAAEAEAADEGEEGMLAEEAFAPEEWTAPSDASAEAWSEEPGTLEELEEAGPAEAEPEPEVEPSPAALAEEAEGAPEGEEELIFPIADYDDLRVSEILPLLPELDEDELQMVREHEQQGRARFSILTRLDQLMAPTGAPATAAMAEAALSQGFEQDITGVGAAVEAEPPAAPEPEIEPPEAVGIEVAATAASFAPPPVEPEAEVAEPAVAQPEVFEAPVAEAPVAEPQPVQPEIAEPIAAEPEVAAAAGVEEPVARAFPIADYEGKKVTEILPLLTNLGADDLAQVAEHERRGKARGSVLTRIEQLVARASETAPPPTAVKKVTAKKTPARKAAEAPATKAAAAKKAATAKKIAAAKAAGGAAEKAPTKATMAPTKAPTKAAKATKATKATKDAAKAPAKKAAPRTTKKQP